jgi:hypothetical protein
MAMEMNTEEVATSFFETGSNAITISRHCYKPRSHATFLRGMFYGACGMHHVAHAKDPAKNPLRLDILNDKHQC